MPHRDLFSYLISSQERETSHQEIDIVSIKHPFCTSLSSPKVSFCAFVKTFSRLAKTKAMEPLLQVFWSIAERPWVLVLAVPVAATLYSLSERRLNDKTNVSVALQELRDAGARRFVRKLVSVLMQQAARGRSDYEFRFRSYDIWFEFQTYLGVFTIPYPISFWDCIDSPGSRAVVKAMLEGEGSSLAGLRVDWCISPKYPSLWAPKWVLACQWDRVDLRTNQIGGR